MSSIDPSNKQPDIITESDVWRDLFGESFDIMEEYIRDPARQLAAIRNITPDTDVKIVQYTLAQLGFNIPRDLVEEHAHIIRRVIHMLPLYYEVAGTDAYPRFVSFLLGRTVDVRNLYTNDYCTFTSKPLGALNIDGGDWYMTTHILLSIQWLESDAERLEIEQRLLDVFLGFAPVTTVVYNYMLHIDLTLKLTTAGKLVIEDTDFLDLYPPEVIDTLAIEGPDEVDQSSSHKYRLKATYVSGDIEYFEFAHWTTSNASASITSLGTANFGRVPVPTQTVISGKHPITGQMSYLPVTIEPNDLEYLVDIEISGLDEIIQGNSTQYTAQGLLSNYTYTTIYPEWSVSDPTITIDQNGNLETQSLTADKIIYVTARSETLGYEVIRSKEVLLKYVPAEVHLTDLQIDQSNVSVTEGTNATLTATATFSNGSFVSVFPVWSVDGPSVILDSTTGKVTGNLVNGNTNVRVTASYSHHGITIEDSIFVLVTAPVVDVDDMFIVGPTTILEKEKGLFKCNILWTTGQVTTVNADWFSSRFDISDSGLFSAGSVSQTETVNISCKFAYGNVIHQRDIDISVLDDVVELESISVIGPDAIKEGESGQFKSYGHWTDGTITEVTANWSIPSEVSAFSAINPITGILAVTDTPTESITEVTASYTLNANTYTYSRQVVFIPIISIIQSLVITGPISVSSNEDIQLLATAYDGNSVATQVIPKWEVLPIDEVNDNETYADIVSVNGILRGRPVDEDKEVLVKATYFKEVAFYTVLVTAQGQEPIQNIVGGRIIGPTTVYPGQTVSYSHAVSYESCSDELLVSSDWSLDVPDTVATITNDGYLEMITPVTTTIAVTSRHTNCPDEVDIRALTVQLMGENITLTSLNIVGPNLIHDNSTTVYTAEVLDSQGQTRTVNPIWTLVGGNSDIVLGNDGILYVDNLVSNTTVTLSAQYSEGSNTVIANKVVNISTIMPVWGVGPIGVDDDAGVLLYCPNEMTTNESGGEFTINVANINNYGYFCHPSSLGTAQFTDTNSNFTGGWDGATWPDNGSIGSTNGPLTILRTINGQPESWKLYRTDFPGIGQFTFRVDYV